MNKLNFPKDKTFLLPDNFSGVKAIHISDQCLAGDVLLLELDDGRAIGINSDSIALYENLKDFIEGEDCNVLDGLDIFNAK